MSTIEQAREVARELNNRECCQDHGGVGCHPGRCQECPRHTADTIDALIAELATLSLDLHTEAAAVIALRAELIEIKSQFEMTLEREVYWNGQYVLLSEELTSLKTKTPVAYVKFRNNEVDYDSDAVISNTAGDCMDESIEWRPVYRAAGAQDAELQKQLQEAEDSRDWYKRRCNELQACQSSMRDPERTMVCDILANGSLLMDGSGKLAADRYAAPAQAQERKPLSEMQKILQSLLGAALGALRYHTEQTRPIHRTNETIKAIELELAAHGIKEQP